MMPPTMIGIFLDPDSLTETLDLTTGGYSAQRFHDVHSSLVRYSGWSIKGSWGHLRSDDDFCCFLVVSILARFGADSDF